MEVDFVFALDGVNHRVIRKRQKPKSAKGAGSTLLELQVEAAGGFVPLSGASVRETEQKIVGLLKMDYETFINSACLRQGRADEFTLKLPSERKKVLAEILGLGEYERLEGRAKAHALSLEGQLDRLRAGIAAAEAEVALRPRHAEDLAVSEAELVVVEGQQQKADAEVRSLGQRKVAFERARNDLEAVERALATTGMRIQEVSHDLGRQEAELERHDATLSRRDEIEEGYRELGKARLEMSESAEAMAQKIRLLEKREEVQKRAESEREQLAKERAGLEARLDEVRGLAKRLPELKIEQAAIEERRRGLEAERAALEAAVSRLAEVERARAEIEGENARLRAEIEKLEANRKLIQDSGTCPVCRRALDHDARDHLVEQFVEEGGGSATVLRENEGKLALFGAEEDGLRRRVDADRPRLTGAERQVVGDGARVEADLKKAEEAEDRRRGLEDAINRLRDRLERKDYAHAERAEYRALSQQIADLGVDQGRHELLQKKEQELAIYEGLYRELATAGEAAEQLRRSLAQLRALRDSREREQDEQEERRKALTHELEGAEAVDLQFEEAEQRARELSERRTELRARASVARQKLDYCDKLAAEIAEEKQRELAMQDERSLYIELAQAFGKKGVPAMLIEAVIPDIEAEANDLLHRMTDGRMTVKLETQRDSKRGDTIETLDIRIADELGTRNYEMFSGGEGFRVNFALRIALSRLLARRAGARLQTLIVDEGFGGLDQAGRDKLVEAINSVRDDFEKILIVTHLEELKDAFDTRIEVTKTEAGSRVAIVA
jgi:exonuclease SbcC